MALRRITKKRKTPPWNLNSKLRSAIRQLWRFSPQRKEALASARIARGRYLCAQCKSIVGPKEIAIDHITPAGTLINDLQGFVDRLFCGVKGLQCLCKPCHKIKTKIESDERTKARRLAKAHSS